MGCVSRRLFGYWLVHKTPTLERIRELLAQNCMLKVDPTIIEDETALFDPANGLGLDSIDALQLAVAIEGDYGVPMKDPQVARQVLQTPATIRHWIERHQGA